jgi:Acyl-CoA dehydrogenase, C-terminal domain
VGAQQDEAIAQGRAPDPVSVLDAQQAFQTLVRAARDMTVFAFDNAGTTVVYATNPLQRCLRDIFTGLNHGILTPRSSGASAKCAWGSITGRWDF